MWQVPLFATVPHLNIDYPYGSVVDLDLLHHLAAMPQDRHRQPCLALQDTADVRALHQDLEEIPYTTHYSSGENQLPALHWQGVFFMSSRTSWTTQEDHLYLGTCRTCPKPFTKLCLTCSPLPWSLWRIVVKTTSNWEFESRSFTPQLQQRKSTTLLKFALQQLHSTCPPAQRQAGHVLIKWLWEHHYDAFGHFEDKHEVQSFYHIRWSTSTSINKQMLCNICFTGCVTTEFFWHLCWVQTCQNKLSLFFSHIKLFCALKICVQCENKRKWSQEFAARKWH